MRVRGRTLPPESQTFNDPTTGARIRQVTTSPGIHHHPFFYIPAHDDAMRWLFFISHREGPPQIFVEDHETGTLIQLTDREDLHEWSLHPSHDGHWAYFTTQEGGFRVSTETFREEKLIDFVDVEKAAGMVGAGMGTTSLSHDDLWWAIPVRHRNGSRLLILHTGSGQHHVACENETIGHPEFHPEDSNLLRYGGPYDRRIWITDREGRDHRLAYRRDATRKEWIVHESWRPGTREILTASWPHGVKAIDTVTGASRWVSRFNAWHPMVDPTGTRMVTDTRSPDIGLQLFAIGAEPSTPHPLCESRASSRGDHWETDHCPYDDGPVEVYAPQHTHPHPRFSPSGRHVVFTSDRGGVAQVYEVEIPEELLRKTTAPSVTESRSNREKNR